MKLISLRIGIIVEIVLHLNLWAKLFRLHHYSLNLFVKFFILFLYLTDRGIKFTKLVNVVFLRWYFFWIITFLLSWVWLIEILHWWALCNNSRQFNWFVILTRNIRFLRLNPCINNLTLFLVRNCVSTLARLQNQWIFLLDWLPKNHISKVLIQIYMTCRLIMLNWRNFSLSLILLLVYWRFFCRDAIIKNCWLLF